MQRNMDLIRRLLLEIESEPSTQYRFEIDGVEELELYYHVDLLVEANLIRGVKVRWASDGTLASLFLGSPVALTWDGHEFLNAARNETVWQQTKEKAQARGLDIQSLTFDLIKSLSVSTIKSSLGL